MLPTGNRFPFSVEEHKLESYQQRLAPRHLPRHATLSRRMDQTWAKPAATRVKLLLISDHMETLSERHGQFVITQRVCMALTSGRSKGRRGSDDADDGEKSDHDIYAVQDIKQCAASCSPASCHRPDPSTPRGVSPCVSGCISCMNPLPPPRFSCQSVTRQRPPEASQHLPLT